MAVKSCTIASSSSLTRSLAALLPGLRATAELFENVPDTVFFAKDLHGRYVAVNRTLVERCGLRSKDDLLKRDVSSVFPTELAGRYAEQDREVLRSGEPIVERLELHWYPHQRTGWCLTTKLPLRDETGTICGLIGISRDLRSLGNAQSVPASLATALEYLESNFGEALTPALLAKHAGLSTHRFARLIKRVFRLTPIQLITQTRLAGASRLLRETDEPVATIAHACGFYDHSAFTRMFRAATGLTPTEFRRREQRAV